jgi:hypothetical protein
MPKRQLLFRETIVLLACFRYVFDVIFFDGILPVFLRHCDVIVTSLLGYRQLNIFSQKTNGLELMCLLFAEKERAVSLGVFFMKMIRIACGALRGSSTWCRCLCRGGTLW